MPTPPPPQSPSQSAPQSPPQSPSTERLARVGGALFGLGVLCSIAAVIPLLAGTTRLPVAVYVGAGLAPVGFGLVLLSLWLRARRRSRVTRAR